jgi:integrase
MLPEAKSRTQAVRLAESILKENEKALIPKGTKSNPNAVEYCLDFWKEDSAYAEEKRLGGHPLSLHYIVESRRLVKNYLSSYLEGKPLLSVTPGDLKEIRRDLARKGYTTRRINCIMQAFRVPHSVFCEDRAIVNPLIVVKKLPENLKKRGILTIEELKAIMEIKDEDPRVMAAVLLGCLCGFRLGECRGLKWESVDTENMTITVKSNFISEKEGLKGCKWGSNRMVPLPSFSSPEPV